MNTEQNKAIARSFYENFHTGDPSTFDTILAPDLKAYAHSSTVPQNREAHVQGILMWNAAFDDSHYTIEEQLAEGDKVTTRVSLRATHSRGPFMGVPPSGKQVSVSGMSIERIEDGLIKERRVSYDTLGMMQQLGLVPPPKGGDG